jgi:hypothetical protein
MNLNQKIRKLDIDDLCMLTFVANGKRLVDAARGLGLSQAALTQRMHKINAALGILVFEKVGNKRNLTEDGKALADTAKIALETLAVFMADYDKRNPPPPVPQCVEVSVAKDEKKKEDKKERKSSRASRCGFLGPGV